MKAMLIDSTRCLGCRGCQVACKQWNGLEGEDRNKWPACVVSCPVQALEKTKEGPVIWHTERCIGCRYCMLACPFHIPKFEWDKAWPQIRKCTMCFDRLKQGKEGFTEPACSKTCPTDAIV